MTTTPAQTYIEHPDKLIRIASVARAMLEEVRDTPCDTAGCERLKQIYEYTRNELASLLSQDLRTELMLMTTAFDETPSPSELRVAQAELVGWLEGLFNGIEAAAMTQHAATMQQTEALAAIDERPMPGQYL